MLIGFLLLAATSCKKSEVASASKSFQSEDEQKLLSSSENGQKGLLSRGLLYQRHSDTTIDLTGPKYFEFNSCTGSRMRILKGMWHIESNHIYNGKLESIQFHTNTSDYRLVDLATGIEYTGSYVSNDVFQIDAVNWDIQDVTTLSIVLTTPGGGNNSKLIANVHVKVDPDGNLILWIDNREEC